MMDANVIRPLCPHTADHEVRFTWPITVTNPDDRMKAEQDSGPICANCAAALWDKLGRYPATLSAVTIHSVTR